MTRLPFVLAITLAVIMFIISLPFLFIIWLLGGDSFNEYVDMMNNIFDN